MVVDPKSAELIKGATLDYNDGFQGAGFHITNPNATRTCGCESSFRYFACLNSCFLRRLP